MPNTIAFGAVATGNINAQLADKAAGNISRAGSKPAPREAAARIGISSAVVAVLLVISVKNVTAIATIAITTMIDNRVTPDKALSGVTRLSIIVVIAIVAMAVTFLTEITSNTATTALLMPILAAASLGAGFEPALLMLPAALSASCAFMLPVATAPNAIVFGTGQVTVEQMVREGLILNLIGILVITSVVYYWLG